MDFPGTRTFAYRFISANWVSLLGRLRSPESHLSSSRHRCCNETDVELDEKGTGR